MPQPQAAPVDFLSAYHEKRLADFYALAPGDTTSALELPRDMERQPLVEALSRYANQLGAPKKVFDSLTQLGATNSRAVVTGQQAGLLLGPSYTLSKAVTAIHLARELSTEAKPVVPIFWVASQDHDTEEINHSYIFDLDETLHRLELDLPANKPAGRMEMKPSWLTALLKEVADFNTVSAHLNDVKALLRETAEVSETYADWFAALLYRLLGPQGLIIINPLEPDIAPLFRSVLEAEIANPNASVNAINDAATALKDLGLTPQLGRGENATNLFLEEEGERVLLRFDGADYYTGTQTYSPEALLELLSKTPSLITPAAGLRPVTQDALLPTAVTVVGPGELRYFAQLKGVYEHHNIAMPLIWPRASATVLEPPVTRIMSKFDLSYAQLAHHFEAEKERILLELHGHAEAFNETLQTLEVSVEDLIQHIEQIDPTLKGSIEKGEGYLRRTVEILKTKSARAIAEQDDTYARQFDRLEAHLFPLGTPQERLISPISFFLKFGINPVMDAFLALPTKGHHELRF